ncbi:MAG: sugar phosphate nucleotidyltransferase [Xanthobacteraceae bacterium]
MKAAILAGGQGSRLGGSEGTPKPLVEIGGRPILWHIMMHYVTYGFRDFVIALGHGGDAIQRFVAELRAGGAGPFGSVELVETGGPTMTGGRIKRLQPYLGDRTFMLTWADGISDVDLRKLADFHAGHGRLATVTAVRPPPRFGRLTLDGNRVTEFSEKPHDQDGWINGAFFVLEPAIFDYVEGDATEWERGPLEQLARDGELMAYRHTGFWACVDTPADLKQVRKLWDTGQRPWATWEKRACASS